MSDISRHRGGIVVMDFDRYTGNRGSIPTHVNSLVASEIEIEIEFELKLK